MDLAFNARAGPLAQIGVHILTLDQVVQLMTGAYGWYKARERTRSLSQLLDAKGAHLVNTSSFDKRVYTQCRGEQGQILGVVVQEGTATSTKLPKASTANPEDPNQACLRALTTGLLCFFNTDATTSILAELIPVALLQMEQEDVTIQIDGPVLTGLKQYVTAVQTEEDSNTIRTELLELASNHQARFVGISLEDVLHCDSLDLCEAPYVIGCMKWMLTPQHKREPTQYPTRSLRVWSLAPIMKKLGFQIAASIEIVRTEEDYKRATASEQFIADCPEVILVATDVGPTDLCMSNDQIVQEEESRPQITPLRGVPWLAFRHLRGSERRVNIQYLVDVWTFSYDQCRRGIEVTCTDPAGHVRLVPKQQQAVGLDHHAALLRIFSPHLTKVCGPAMSAFVPIRCEGTDWLPETIEEHIRILRTSEDAFQPDPNVRDNCYVLIAIVLGTIYGIVSKFCRENDKEICLDSEIAFQPDIVYKSRFKTWATFISIPLVSPPSYKDWNLMLLEVVLGKRSSELNGFFSDGDTGVSHNGKNGTASAHQLPIGIVLGAQANGMAAVLDVLVRPSLRPEAVLLFHIARGQMLSFPIGQHGYIEASQRQELSLTMALDPNLITQTLKMEAKVGSYTALRIDAEPCWEGDPQTVVLRCRRDGIPLCPLNIGTILSRLQQASVPCACAQPGLTVSMPTNDWNIIEIDDLTRRTFSGSSRRRVDLRGDSPQVYHVFVDASESEAATLYAIGSIHCQDMLICHRCLTCLGKRYAEKWRKGSCVIVNARVSVC